MRRLLPLALLLVVPAVLPAQQGPEPRRGRWQEQLPDTPVVNAKSAWIGGVTTYSRGDYQPSAIEVQYGVRTPGWPVGAVSVGLRTGSFVQNQAVLIGRTQGFFVGVVGTLRRPLGTVLAIGDENNLSYVKLEFLLEGTAALNANNPMPQGGRSAIVAALLAVTFGGRGVLDQGLSILAGPAYFMGDYGTWHTQVGLRFQNPRR
jgi:hypothetical protein